MEAALLNVVSKCIVVMVQRVTFIGLRKIGAGDVGAPPEGTFRGG
jgi:hypothetical protein